MINLATGNSSAPLHERKDDLYETPQEAVEALLRVETLPHHIWEPAAGPGAYKNATKFVAHALELCPRVIMLLRLAFLASQRLAPILDGGHLARIYPFSNRLPMMHRAGWTGNRASSAIDYAWFIWDRSSVGPTICRRIAWKGDRRP